MSRGTCEVTGSSREESRREPFARGAGTELQPLARVNPPARLPRARGHGPRRWSPRGPGPVRTMANVVVKTIWQSKEINEAGDPPSGAETRAQSRRWSPRGPGPVRTMANVVVKTIWQSKEINEAGDPPSGAETRAQSTRDLLGKASPKAFPRKKKAESCRKVSQSVEDAEIKTNALKKSSVLLEELEQAALDTHARAETLSSNLRLAQDEALRAKTYVERVRLSPQ
ncbi:Testis-specific serine kinase substrate [Chelonia mydas]|uniref:Testis-specific serine kinase substrate n=1 Tax=Chelonia mydas TaxID=8469 RepID=M7C233_CHEMY|nr:Testis-specific serine kinase substrate [Chelonia mydas]